MHRPAHVHASRIDRGRESLIGIADETADILTAQCYEAASGHMVDLAQPLDRMIHGVQMVEPTGWDAVTATAMRVTPGMPADLQVRPMTTLEAIRQITDEHPHEPVAALCFASARHRGGGWRSGAVAQEEVLARSSALTLGEAAAPGFYANNTRCRDRRYTDSAILVPHCPIFRIDDGYLLDAPIPAHVVVMPAPNVAGCDLSTYKDVPRIFQRRIGMVMAAAVAMGARHMVLGAWGCGVFGNDPSLVAQAHLPHLVADAPWRRRLSRIVWAIPTSPGDTTTHDAFASVLTQS